jgi:hypothetical protein
MAAAAEFDEEGYALLVGSVLGLLAHGDNIDTQEAKTNLKALRWSAATFGEELTALSRRGKPLTWVDTRPSRLPPVMSLPVVPVRNKLYAKSRDLASAGIDAAAGCTKSSEASLPEYLTKLSDNARQGIPDLVSRAQRAETAERFDRPEANESEGGRTVMTPASASGGALVASGCLLDGYEAIGLDRPPLGAIVRLLGPLEGRERDEVLERVTLHGGDEVLTDARWLIFGRRAWLAAVRGQRMPKVERFDADAFAEAAYAMRAGQRVKVSTATPLVGPAGADVRGVIEAAAKASGSTLPAVRLLGGLRSALGDGGDVLPSGTALPYAEAGAGGVRMSKARLLRDADAPAVLASGKALESAWWWPTAAEAMAALAPGSTSVREALTRSRMTSSSVSAAEAADLGQLVAANAELQLEGAAEGEEDGSATQEDAEQDPSDARQKDGGTLIEVALVALKLSNTGPPASTKAVTALAEAVGRMADLETQMKDNDDSRCKIEPLYTLPFPPNSDAKALKGSRALSLTGLMRGGPPSPLPEAASAAQGHMRLADAVLVRSAAGDGLMYDHVRAVEPNEACNSALTLRLRRDEAALLISSSRTGGDTGMWTALVKAWASAVRSAASTTRAFRAGSTRTWKPPDEEVRLNASAEGEEGDYDSMVAGIIGAADMPHYRSGTLGTFRDLSAAKNRDAILDASVPASLLAEMAALIGLSPPIGISEQRVILDELETLMPGGEGEQGRQLRRRLADVKARRAELMVKADASGPKYEAIERRLIERLRADAEPKVLGETAAHIGAILSALVESQPGRLASAPSPALLSCLRGKTAGGGGGSLRSTKRSGASLAAVLTCALSTVLSGRVLPPGPSDAEVTSYLQDAVGHIGADTDALARRLQQASSGGLEAKKSGDTPPWAHFRPRPEQPEPQPSRRGIAPARRLLSELWTHVRSEQPTLALGAAVRTAGRDRKRFQPQQSTASLLLLHPAAAACCSYSTSADSSSAWSHLAANSEAIALALKSDQDLRRRGGESDARAVVGIPPATPPNIALSRQDYRAGVEDEGGIISNKDWSSTEAMPVLSAETVLSALSPSNENIEETLALVLSFGEGTPLADELSPGGGADALASETARRFEDFGRRLALGHAADELRNALLLPLEDDELAADAVRVARGFLMHELGPTLSRLSRSEVGGALSADRELSAVAGALSSSEVTQEKAREVRTRLAALAAACPVTARACEAATLQGMSSAAVRPVAGAATVFVLWSVSRVSEGLPRNAGEALSRALASLATRLAERLAHTRRDRYEEEETRLRERVDEARQKRRQAEESLTDEQREMLRELRRINPGVQAAPSEGGEIRVQQQQSEVGEEDAINMYS